MYCPPPPSAASNSPQRVGCTPAVQKRRGSVHASASAARASASVPAVMMILATPASQARSSTRGRSGSWYGLPWYSPWYTGSSKFAPMSARRRRGSAPRPCGVNDTLCSGTTEGGCER